MSSVLPQELFNSILGKLAEPPLDYKDYCTSKDALAKAARSSRCLYSAAQANLWRTIWLRDTTDDEFEAIEAAAAVSKLGTRTTSLFYLVGQVPTDEGFLSDVVDVAHVFPGIVDMHILCTLDSTHLVVDFEDVHTHTKLRHLALFGIVLVDVPSGALPALEMLEIGCCSISTSVARKWLQPDVLPCVRVLSMVNNHEDGLETTLDVEAVIAPALYRQLDYAQFDAFDLDPDSALANGVVPPVLVAAGSIDLQTLPRHAEPCYGVPVDGSMIEFVLSRVVGELHRSTASAPFVVVLPRTVLKIAAEDEYAAAAVRRLEAKASAHAARVMWTPAAPGWDSQARMSSEFRAYGRALRLAREAS